MSKLEEQVETLDFQMNGDPRDNDSRGLKGEVQDLKKELEPISGIIDGLKRFGIKTLTALVIAAFLAAFTYFVDTMKDDSRKDVNSHGSNSHVMDSDKKLLRGR